MSSSHPPEEHNALIDIYQAQMLHDSKVNIPELAPKVRETYGRLGAYKAKPLSDGVSVSRKEPVAFENGSVYIGEWSFDNQRHGLGKIITAEGAVFEG
jgi:hypothetical protein